MSTTPTSPAPASAPTTILDGGQRLLHVWNVTLDKDVDETTSETRDGQTISVTRKVKKPVSTRMALRALKRPEMRAAELFQASRTAHYVKDHGLLLASELTNRLINTTGGVLTDKEKSRIEQLKERHVQLDMDLARGVTTLPPMEKDRIQKELAKVRAELIDLNAINQAVYAQTAEAKAEADLLNWLTFTLTLIDRGTPEAPRWTPYFEGEKFEDKEAFMWKLEDTQDEFYTRALPLIARYSYWLSRGADSAAQFKLMDEELAKQEEARKEAEKEEAAKTETVVKVETATSTETVEPAESSAVSPAQ